VGLENVGDHLGGDLKSGRKINDVRVGEGAHHSRLPPVVDCRKVKKSGNGPIALWMAGNLPKEIPVRRDPTRDRKSPYFGSGGTRRPTRLTIRKEGAGGLHWDRRPTLTWGAHGS